MKDGKWLTQGVFTHRDKADNNNIRVKCRTGSQANLPSSSVISTINNNINININITHMCYLVLPVNCSVVHLANIS